MIENIKANILKNEVNFLLRNKLTLGLIAVAVLIIFAGVFAYQRIAANNKAAIPIQEVDLTFDPEGPYALLLPRRDGNAIDLVIKRISAYDGFSYQISYTDETGIDRGAGDLNTWIEIDKGKSEFEQEILFGTCSKGDTSDPLHCVFDKGVENGTLVVRIRKGEIAYKSSIPWHFQKPDIDLGKITSPDLHFQYNTEAQREDLALVGFTTVNDLTGAPKLPDGKKFLGKVYALNVPKAKTFPEGEVLIELAENPPTEAQIAHFIEADNEWKLLETKVEGSKLTANATRDGIFAVLVNSQ